MNNNEDISEDNLHIFEERRRLEEEVERATATWTELFEREPESDLFKAADQFRMQKEEELKSFEREHARLLFGQERD